MVSTGRGWTQGWRSNSEGCLASSFSPVSGGSYFQMSSFEVWLASSLSPVSGRSYFRRTAPPPRLLEAQKTRGVVYFMWLGEIFLSNFLPYPQYSRVQGGDMSAYVRARCTPCHIMHDSHMNHMKSTSSTAQGGGGSFKNRKPIGEVGCRESRMAKRIHWWTERWLELCFLAWLQWLQLSPHHSCWMQCGVMQL